MVDLKKWVGESLAVQRGIKSISLSELDLVKSWILESMKMTPTNPIPLGIIADIGRILTSSFSISDSKPIFDTSMSKALSAYEEHFLGRILSDYRLERYRELLLRMTHDQQVKGIALVLDQIISRLKCTFESPVASSISNFIVLASSKSLHESFLEALGGPLQSQLENYSKLANAAKQQGSILSDAEIYILENLDVLTTSSQRLAINMVADAAQKMSQWFPHRTQQVRDRGSISTNITDENNYPIGGYAGISTQGSLESLVGSELIYMDPTSSIDMFDIRFISNELLKFTRNDSVHHRERRNIFIFFDRDLHTTKKKDPELPFQRLILWMAGILSGVQKTIKWLDTSELKIHLIFDPKLEDQMNIMSLLLREHIKTETAIVGLGSWGDYRDQIEATSKRSLVDILWVYANEALELELDDEGQYLVQKIEIQKNPRLRTESKTLEFDASLIDWATLFSKAFQSMV